MEQLIQSIIDYVRDNHIAMGEAGVPSPPQAVVKALVIHLRIADNELDERSVHEALDEMDARGWVIDRGDGTVIFDEAML